MTDFSHIFLLILHNLDPLCKWFSSQGAFFAILLMVVISAVRVGWIAYQQGYEQATIIFRQRLGFLALVLALCLPSPLLGGYSFLSWFPKATISGGFYTANKLIYIGKLGHWGKTASKKDNALLHLPENLQDEFKKYSDELKNRMSTLKQAIKSDEKIQTYAKDMEGSHGVLSSSFWRVLKATAIYFLTIILLIPLLLVGVFLLSIPAVGTILFGALVVFTQIVALLASLKFGYGVEAVGKYDLISYFFHALMNALGSGIFVGIIIFGFYGVLLSTLVKGIIYAVTFPITAVHLAFDSQRQVFIGHILKGLQIAITPIVAAVIFAVSCEAYNTLLTSGIYNAMRNAFIGNPENVHTFWGLITWAFRSLSATFITGGIISIPIARYIIQSGRVAHELLGQGVTFASGLKERMGRGYFGFS